MPLVIISCEVDSSMSWWSNQARVRDFMPSRPSPARRTTGPLVVGLPIHGVPVDIEQAIDRATKDLNREGCATRAARLPWSSTDSMSQSVGFTSSKNELIVTVSGVILGFINGINTTCLS